MTADTSSDTSSQLSQGEPKVLGLAAVALFVLLAPVVMVHLLVEQEPGWLDTARPILGALFGLTLLAYLGNGGREIVCGKRSSDRKLTWTERVGRVGTALLSLSLLGNFVAALWEPAPGAVKVARDVASVCFTVCFVAYLVLRYRAYQKLDNSIDPHERRRSQLT